MGYHLGEESKCLVLPVTHHSTNFISLEATYNESETVPDLQPT
jgi:hypothetical protein